MPLYIGHLPVFYSDDALRGAFDRRPARRIKANLDPFSRSHRKDAVEVPLGFCFGGFSSTAGYVPGNEARVCCEQVSRATFVHLSS